jgi:hypothetical protein
LGLLFLILPVLLSLDVWAAPVRLSIGTHTGRPGETVGVPILVEGAAGQEVLAYKVVITFNPVVLTYKAISVKGTAIESWGRPVVNPQDDRITMVGGGITPVSQDGTFLVVEFDILPDAAVGARSALSFSQVRLNEGVPEAVTTDGVLVVTREGEVVGGEIRLSVGTVSAKSGETIPLPVSISGTLGNEIRSCRVVLMYDPKILRVLGVSLDGTVAQSWGSPVMDVKEGEVTISTSGTSPLTQDGILMKVRFEVAPDAPAGSGIAILLKETVLNDGALHATMSNGAITVSVSPSGPLTLSIGNILGQVGDSVAVPVVISGAQGRDILAFRITLRYSSRFLTLVDVVTQGTVAEGWASPAFKAERDTLSIAAAGVSALDRDGELIRLIFTVSPKAPHGMKSSLSFLLTAFESLTQPGEFPATTQNGALIVVDSSAVEGEGASLDAGRPESPSLEQNYPNPFNMMTMIRYSLPESADVRLAIYDTTGRLITTLAEERQRLGRYVVQWDGRDEHGVGVASGVYFYRMTSGQFTAVKKMTLVK